MKRVLVLLSLGLMMGSFTGCAHKKRVKQLEADITACRAKKAELQGRAAVDTADQPQLAANE